MTAVFSDLTQPHFLESFLDPETMNKIREGNFPSQLYPPFSDRKAWDEIKTKPVLQPWYNGLLKIVQEIPPVPELLPHSLYREFGTIGNRTNYERKYFKRRWDLFALILAMCVTGDKEKYLPTVVDHLYAMMGEPSWCLPAHRRWDGVRLLDIDISDLFASETAANMALAVNIIGDELEDYPGLRDWISRRVLDYVYRPLLPETQNYHIWYITNRPFNWTPWCSYNLALSAICLEKDPLKRSMVLQKYMERVSCYINNSPDNGYCLEGPAYYYRAGGMVFKFALLMDKILPRSMEKFYTDEKVRNLFEFVAKVTIGNDYVAFADSRRKGAPDYSSLYLSAQILNSSMLKGFAAANPMQDYIYRSHGPLSDNLPVIFDLKEDFTKWSCNELTDTLFPDRLAVLRSEKFSVALKAGDNQESHSHNDLGHVTVYYGNTPIIFDAGTGGYEKINFGEFRYTLWYTRGSGHNGPVFGGIEQQSGPQYTATVKEITKTENGKQLICDLSNAYPTEAGVQKFLRQIDHQEDQVVITDDFELAKPLSTEVFLLSVDIPEVTTAQQFKLGNIMFTLQDIDYIDHERISDDKFDRTSQWGGPVYRIRLRSDKNRYQLKLNAEV